MENVPATGGRAARVEPLGRPAAGRRDDREGDPRGASPPAPAQHHRRALLQGLPGLLHAAARRSAAWRRTRRTCTGSSTTRSSWCWCSPRAARAPRSSTRTATACAVSGAAASWRRPCAPRRRSCPCAWWARRRRRPCSPSSGCSSGSPGCSTSRSRRPSRTSACWGCSATCRPSSSSASSSPSSFDEQGDSARRQGARADRGARGARADPGEPLGHAGRAEVGLVRMSVAMDSRRILLTGLSTYWGGRLAQALEAFPRSRP